MIIPTKELERLLFLLKWYIDNQANIILSQVTCKEVYSLLVELKSIRDMESTLPPSPSRVSSDFIRDVFKDSFSTGDHEVDPISVSIIATKANQMAAELLARRHLEEIHEPDAWMSADGRLLSKDLKRRLGQHACIGSFSIPLYQAVTVKKADDLAEKIDPLLAERWICMQCMTVNNTANGVCTGCGLIRSNQE